MFYSLKKKFCKFGFQCRISEARNLSLESAFLEYMKI